MGPKRRIIVAATLTAALAVALAQAAAAAPLKTISRYVSVRDTSRWYDLGCALGNAVRDGTRPRNAGVILQFGSPRYAIVNGDWVYGSNLYDGDFIRTSSIRAIAQQYGRGYYVCSPVDTSLTIAITTSNYGSHLRADHCGNPDISCARQMGRAWANLVDAGKALFCDP